MMPYILIRNIDLRNLVGEVNDMIAEGYIPIGGVTADPAGPYIQAMYNPSQVRPA